MLSNLLARRRRLGSTFIMADLVIKRTLKVLFGDIDRIAENVKVPFPVLAPVFCLIHFLIYLIIKTKAGIRF